MDSEKYSLLRLPETTSRIVICCAVAFCSTAHAQAGTDESSAGVDALDEFVAHVETLSAKFRQDVWTSDNELIETSTGTMSLERPSKFYWHFETAPEMIVVADGEILWTYDLELAQVARTPLADMTAASPAMLLSGDTEWRDQFDVAKADRLDERDWIEIAPKAEGGGSETMDPFRFQVPTQVQGAVKKALGRDMTPAEFLAFARTLVHGAYDLELRSNVE